MSFQLFPVEASSISGEVDQLLFFLVAVAAFFTIVIFGAIFYFAIRYRRRSDNELPAAVHGSIPLEIVWMVIPFGLTMVMFTWGASIFFRERRPPDNALPIYVVAKQWMWKLQHPEGQREINELHVPVGRPVKLVMTSEDVVHSFFIPVFRIKKDVVPGTYSTVWFQADLPGQYHLFCSQYCGNQHSGMVGWVYVMEPRDYENWLSGGSGGNMAAGGEKLFQRLGCNTCHLPGGNGRGPVLQGLYGQPVLFEDGTKGIANDEYIRES